MKIRFKQYSDEKIIKIAFCYIGLIAAAGIYIDLIAGESPQQWNKVWIALSILNGSVFTYLLDFRDKKRKLELKNSIQEAVAEAEQVLS